MSALKDEIGENLLEEEEIYKENIIDHYKHPHNKRILAHPTIMHRELNPICGDEITIYLRIQNDVVSEVAFQGHGCAISQAAISMLTDKLKSMPLAEVRKITKEDILTILGIPISIVRMKCALLSLKAVHEGIKHA